MTGADLAERFGEDGWKQLPDEVYRRYGFTPAKVEVEEHHVKVYAGRKTDEIVRVPHPESLLRGSLVSPSLEVAVLNASGTQRQPPEGIPERFQRGMRYGRISGLPHD